MAVVFWIFSYNRGEFLQNCVASIERCAPNAVINIFDDNSTDANTIECLQRLAQRCPIHYPEPNNSDGNKHGGLYANMQGAFEKCNADDLVFFLQDDTQLVREVTPQEFDQLQRYFTKYGPGFVQTAFIRGCNRQRDKSRTRFDNVRSVYFIDRLKSSAGAFYSDICAFNVQQLRDVKWRFVPRESGNEEAAREKLQQMAYWRNPFIAWLPNVPAFRGKTQTFALRRAQQIRPCGFFPIQILNDEENRNFIARSPQQIPYAEDFLRVPVKLPQPWIYYPLQGMSALKQLNNIELKLRKWLRL